jgi:hypothetical protein
LRAAHDPVIGAVEIKLRITAVDPGGIDWCSAINGGKEHLSVADKRDTTLTHDKPAQARRANGLPLGRPDGYEPTSLARNKILTVATFKAEISKTGWKRNC